MAKLERLDSVLGWVYYSFECPGCGFSHLIKTSGPHPVWDFNGDLEKPTFNPSLRVTYDTPTVHTVCHSYVRDGNIQFLGDSTHSLAGQTVPLADIE